MADMFNTLSLVALIYITMIPWYCNGSIQMNDTKRLHTKLLTGYNSDIRPVLDQETPVYLNISFGLLSLLNLDEVSGSLKFVGLFHLEWMDESMVWDPASYGGVKELSVSQGKVWQPELVLLSAANEIHFVGKTENDFYKISYFPDGYAEFGPTERIESACHVNVQKYPFDIQECEVFFVALGYRPTQLELMPKEDMFNMQYYQGNSVWDIVNTSVYVSDIDDLVLALNFKLKRKSAFVVVNVLLPITLLGFLNVLVFLLVPESGERISYCITVLLAISVFMTIISDTLPKSSDPVPIISYKLMIDVIISMLITVVTILNLRLHNKDDDKQVPSVLKNIYLAVCCRSCKRKKSDYSESIDDNSSTDRTYPHGNSRASSAMKVYQRQPYRPDHEMTRRIDERERRMEYLPKDEKKVTWKHIAAMYDAFAFVFFSMAVVASFIVFIIITQK